MKKIIPFLLTMFVVLSSLVQTDTPFDKTAFKEDNGELCGMQVCVSEDEDTLHIPLDGLFIAVGLEPQNDCFSDLVQLDSWGYIQSDESCLTKTPGIFAAGDTRTKHIRQLTTAVSDGTVAAIAACSFLG